MHLSVTVRAYVTHIAGVVGVRYGTTVDVVLLQNKPGAADITLTGSGSVTKST